MVHEYSFNNLPVVIFRFCLFLEVSLSEEFFIPIMAVSTEEDSYLVG